LDSDSTSTWTPFELWHDSLGDPTLADAILDRLVHNAHRIALKGEAMRRKKTTATSNTVSPQAPIDNPAQC